MASPTIKPKKLSFLPIRSMQQKCQGVANHHQDSQASPSSAAANVNSGGIFCFLRVFRLANMMTQTGC